MLKGLGVAGKSRRRRYSDLTFDAFKTVKKDGRRFTYYWTEAEKRVTIYRYQWVRAHTYIT
jgi:hypothetical protein